MHSHAKSVHRNTKRVAYAQWWILDNIIDTRFTKNNNIMLPEKKVIVICPTLVFFGEKVGIFFNLAITIVSEQVTQMQYIGA